jgi:aspartyl-tRNA(Asn)/glutamyl-tRNA(Gln) amidotransferase subunit C
VHPQRAHPKAAEKETLHHAVHVEIAMALSGEDVRWVAHLARLELNDAELAAMTNQLRAILDFVDQLQQVNTEGVEPLAHPLPVQNVFREDEPSASLTVSSALANAPAPRDGFFGVPAVLE